MSNQVVLAFSGGLDTTYCALYLARERGLEVHAVTVDTGGFSLADRERITQRAQQCGVAAFTWVDATADFYQHCLRYLIFGNILRYQTYPLSVSTERVFQAVAVARHARQMGAGYVAHGSTGAGNDQVRFDLAFRILIPGVQVITPIREHKLSRQAEIAYLQAAGIPGDWEKALYSVNQGLWGTTVGGKETLTSHLPLPEEAWPVTRTATLPRTVTLGFTAGELTTLEGQPLPPIEALQQLEEWAAPYGIGRDVHVGDTIVGIKGRVGFQAAAPLLVLKAHHLLEKHTLGKWQLYWKQQLAEWYGMMLHEGQFLDPSLRSIEQFLLSTQGQVTGEVSVELLPGHFRLLGVQSPYDLLQPPFGQYGEMNQAWEGADVEGFAKVAAIPASLYYSLHPLPDFLQTETSPVHA
jgi:argininosuccinate synthase